jgi:hypothetical protein
MIGTVHAQGGVLTLGQPAIADVPAGGTVVYDYTLAETAQVVLQAFGETAQPTITIRQGDQVVAQEANTNGASTVTLNTLLNAGSYTVEIGAANGTSGIIILVLESESPATATPLQAGVPVAGEVYADAPLALYAFTGLGEPAYLYVESGLAEAGLTAQVVHDESGRVVGALGAAGSGARFRIRAGTGAYSVAVTYGESGAAEPFTLCLTTASAGGCEPGTALDVAQPTQAPQPPVATEEVTGCVVSPTQAGGSNIRQSASVDAPVLVALPGGAFASVSGISPDGSFYNVTYNGVNGWVAASAVSIRGDCAGITVVNPPAFSQPPAPQPTQPPQALGPCLIRMTGEALVYSQPNAAADFIYDEVQPGFELIPVGRLADDSFWRTNYANAWISTSLFGTAAQVSGDCSALPIVSP